MNKTLTFLLMTTAVLLMTASCKSPDDQAAIGTIELSMQETTIGAEGGEFTVDVESSHEFSIRIPSSSKWISVDPDENTYTSGTLTFTVEENTTTADRTGRVIFECLDTKDTLTVVQAGGEDTFHSTFLQNTEPGIYGESFDSFSYTEYKSQYAIRQYTTSDVFDYKLININPPQYIYIRSIPNTLEAGSSHSIGLIQNVTTEINPNYFYSFTIDKIEDGKIWMYNSINRFGIILTQE